MATKTTAPAKVEQPQSLSALQELFASKGVTFAEQESDPEALALEMARRIFEADSVDDILGETDLTHARDILDTNIFVDGIDFQSSDFQGGAGIYSVLRARRMDSPEEGFIVTCGSTTVMAQVIRAGELDQLPLACRITQAAKPTKSGYYPLQLRKAKAIEADPEPF